MCGYSHTQNVIVHYWRCVTSPQSALVDPVAASSSSYPAAPGSAPPDSCNLHLGLLQQHLWTVTLLLVVVVLIAFSIFPKQFATCKMEVVTPLTCITQLWVLFPLGYKKKKSQSNHGHPCITGHPGSSSASQKCPVQLWMTVQYLFVCL